MYIPANTTRPRPVQSWNMSAMHIAARPRTVLFAFAFVLALSGLPHAVSAQRITFEQMGIAEGLSNNSVTSICRPAGTIRRETGRMRIDRSVFPAASHSSRT